jgi:2,3-bisphosphoglycerate-dependent phosphoglycerate mutase
VRRLILVKHSLPTIVPERPRREWQLSEEGRLRSGRLAEHLRPYGPDHIATSPEIKARETATILAHALGGLPIDTVDDLREHDDGDVPFQTEEAFRETVRDFFRRPSEPVFGPESADATNARFSGAILGLPEPRDGQSVVAVAHGRVISLFVARRAGLDAYELWRRLGLPSMVVLSLPTYEIERVIETA